MTPTQARLFVERKERLARMASRALIREVAVMAREQLAENAKPAMTIKQAEAWMAEQLAKVTETALPKLWFSIADRPGEVSIQTIQRTVCAHYSASLRDMLSARRSAGIVFPRHVAMYIAKTMTMKSLPDIGRRFGGRDHSTVLHGVRRITALIASGHPVAKDIDTITEILEGLVGSDDAGNNNSGSAASGKCEQDAPDRLAQPEHGR